MHSIIEHHILHFGNTLGTYIWTKVWRKKLLDQFRQLWPTHCENGKEDPAKMTFLFLVMMVKK